MEKEVLFAQTLERVRRMAREQGNYIGKEQVRKEFAALELDEDQLGKVLDYLAQHQVGIDEPSDPDACLTESERDYLQDYLEQIKALAACSEGEREAYIISAMAGEEEARQRLAELCLGDVADIARLYGGQGVPMEDLIGEGNMALTLGIGMLGCLEKPSQAQGMLARRIMDAMEECIRENDASRRKDRKVADRVNQVADKAGELSQELRRKVTPRELSRETGLTVKAIEDAMRMSGGRIESIEWTQYSQSASEERE